MRSAALETLETCADLCQACAYILGQKLAGAFDSAESGCRRLIDRRCGICLTTFISAFISAFFFVLLTCFLSTFLARAFFTTDTTTASLPYRAEAKLRRQETPPWHGPLTKSLTPKDAPWLKALPRYECPHTVSRLTNKPACRKASASITASRSKDLASTAR